ncbi:MAG TPA: hypothetical protein PKE29_18725 [Phycisphaerales bacterium]|nr:hypothetical protein [Phycisphaerales bacterium]
MKPHPKLRKTIKWTGAAATVMLVMVWMSGCKPSGPTSTKTTSSGMATISQRVNFLHEYVTFRRTYETLDFDIAYHNNGGGMVPGPSDWDLRLVATVPADEMPAWIPPGVSQTSAPDVAWLKSVPTALDLSGVSEWYVDGNRLVGLDRGNRIVVYRFSTH